MVRTLVLLAAVLSPILIEVEPEVIPEPTPYVCQEADHFDWTDDEINQVAKVLYAETGKGSCYAEKEAICCLILNRVRYGHPFADDIVGVCKQKGEFNRGKVTDRNKVIARECLDRYESQLHGNLQKILVPLDALYMGRVNGILTFYNMDKQIVYEVR